MNRLIIIGAGGHGKVAADIALRMCAYDEIAFLDDNVTGEVMGIAVLGRVETVDSYVADSEIFVAVGNSAARERITSELVAKGANIPALIHPNAVFGCGVEIGKGTLVAAGAIINPCAKIGAGVIVNTKSSVDHDCVIGDFSHVSVGVTVAGSVRIGRHVWVGAGATVINNAEICDECMIGAGAVVVKSLSAPGKYVGVPATRMEK